MPASKPAPSPAVPDPIRSTTDGPSRLEVDALLAMQPRPAALPERNVLGQPATPTPDENEVQG